ncbi:MAG: hypothetical protein ACM31D_12875 [Bacteroidota bacterium]
MRYVVVAFAILTAGCQNQTGMAKAELSGSSAGGGVTAIGIAHQGNFTPQSTVAIDPDFVKSVLGKVVPFVPSVEEANTLGAKMADSNKASEVVKCAQVGCQLVAKP